MENFAWQQCIQKMKMEQKSDTFENIYSAGQLNVSRDCAATGNLGDENKYFEFKVTLTGETGKACLEHPTL